MICIETHEVKHDRETILKSTFLASLEKWKSWPNCCCSVIKLCPSLCNPMNCSKLSFPVLYYLPEFAQTQVHGVSDAIQPSHLLSSPSPPPFNPSQHQGLFQRVISLHQVAKVLGLQLQHQSFQ